MAPWKYMFLFLSILLANSVQNLPIKQDSISIPWLLANTVSLQLISSTNDSDVGRSLREIREQYVKRRGTLPSKVNSPDPEDIPVNFIFHNFPNIAFENAAKRGVVDALSLANAALAATEDLTSAYHRYFRDDEIDTVRQVFESIITESVYVQCSDSFTINIWFEDSVGDFDGCAQGLAAYHLTPGPGVVGLNIVLCTQLFQLYPNPLNTIPRNVLKDYADESMETVGLTVLHEMTHLATVVGGIVISDIYIESSMDTSSSNPRGTVKAYGPYLAMMTNKDEHAGSLNADNYAFFAAEAYFMQEYDIEGFSDPPPSQSSNFHPARSIEGYADNLSSARKITASNSSIGFLDHAIKTTIPPLKVSGPGFPQNWIFNRFQYEDRHLLDLSVEGLMDAWRLADVAAQSLLGPLSSSYLRYFDDDEACQVRDVFLNVLQQANLPLDPSRNLRDWNIYYDDIERNIRDCPKRTDYAYFIEIRGLSEPSIVICPLQFETTMNLLDTISCDEVEPHASEDTMDNVGATLLHKMLHDYGLTGEAGVFAMDAELETEVVNSDGSTTTRIIAAYGPYWSHFNRVQQDSGTDNVDNFVWYALETWFTLKCGIVFGDPALTSGDVRQHALRDLRAVNESRLLGRQLSYNGTKIVRQAPDTSASLPLLPPNIKYVDFPSDGFYEGIITHGLVNAWILAESALWALDQNSQEMSTTYLRYFQAYQRCMVRKVFEAVLSVSGATQRTLAAANREYLIFFGDTSHHSNTCSEQLVAAFMSNPPTPNTNNVGPDMVLCPLLFQNFLSPVDWISCDTLGSQPALNFAWLGYDTVMLHELIHDYELTQAAVGFRIRDMVYPDKLDIDINGDLSPVKGYGPYWSMWLNKERGDGILNADNYAIFATEAYLARKCGVGLDGFRDPQKVPLNPSS